MVIAFENSLLHLCQEAPDPAKGCLTMDDSDPARCLAALTAGNNVHVLITHGIRNFIQYLMSHYRYVKAAGGVVTTPEGDCLMISRDSRWDLPKGMVETGESLRQAARREVMEETGVSPDTVGRLIVKTYHIYDKYGGWHLKQTSWFAMAAPRQATRPQSEEDIAQAVWASPEVCRQRLAGSYASLRLVAERMPSPGHSRPRP